MYKNGHNRLAGLLILIYFYDKNVLRISSQLRSVEVITVDSENALLSTYPEHSINPGSNPGATDMFFRCYLWKLHFFVDIFNVS